jgi:hypothetical protein
MTCRRAVAAGCDGGWVLRRGPCGSSAVLRAEALRASVGRHSGAGPRRGSKGFFFVILARARLNQR